MSIRKGKRYPYGIHVKDMKELCADSPIEKMPAPKKVYISMSQHIGAPAIPIVGVGDKVTKRQLIGQASGVISANVYSSICGTVTTIEDIVNGNGQKMKYVVIENDGREDEVFFEPIADFEPATIIERIRLAGIVGLGGAGFPTAVKLSPTVQLDTLIVNGAECEPYLTCDYRLMIENTDDIYRGIKYAARALNIKKIIIGIEANKPQAIKAFEKYPDLDVVVLKKQYPMGSEKHLIYCTTGRKVPCGKMPFDVGVCVQNIKTVIAIKHSIEDNKALSSTVLTVSGKGINTPKNLRVQIGTPLEEIIEFCGGENGSVVKVIAGGPMMGKGLINLNAYTRKTDSGFLFLDEKEAPRDISTNCINCGECARNCPMRLMPMYIESYSLAGDFKNAEKYGAMNCIECGSCAYNCPAKRYLVQSIQLAKSAIKEMKKNGR
ncbi:MAG: electron transport complex subunit RsxC [Clostridia bacterium]|nr:electron transport complex subunit RsxC [Clostridia bacterium]